MFVTKSNLSSMANLSIIISTSTFFYPFLTCPIIKTNHLFASLWFFLLLHFCSFSLQAIQQYSATWKYVSNYITKTVFFGCVLGNIARGLNNDSVYEVGAMTEGNIVSADQKNSYCCIYCQRVEVEKKPFHFPVASLYNGFTLPGRSITLQWLCTF